MSSKKLKIDLIVIGNPNSGKTSLIRRFIDGQSSFSHFYSPTLGLNLEKKVIKLQDTDVTTCIWDTAGQEKFFSLTKNYFKKADGVLIIFDLTDRASYQRVSNFWINEVKQKSQQNCAQLLIGNKHDLSAERVVSSQQAQTLAAQLKIQYFQTSAKTGNNVFESIEFLVKECLSRIKQTDSDHDQQDKIELQKTEVKTQDRSCISDSKQYIRGILSKIKN